VASPIVPGREHLVTRRPVTALVAPIALLVAITIWLGYAYLALQPGSPIVQPSDVPVFVE
jgi:hypothetical protein